MQHRGVAGLEAADLQRLGPGVLKLVALDRRSHVVVDDDGAALAGVGSCCRARDALTHCSKLLSDVSPRVRVTSPAFGPPGSFLMMYLPSAVFAFISITSCSIFKPGNLLDLLDHDAVELEAEGMADTGVKIGKSHACYLLVVCGRAGAAATASTRLVPPENCDRRKTTNSAGLTGATPISQTTWPRSMPSAGLVSSSHLT